MNKDIINGVILEDSVKIKQSSRGTWHVDLLTVCGSNMKAIVKKLDEAMTDVEKVLEAHNLQVKSNLY